jgi:hypothetical protein
MNMPPHTQRPHTQGPHPLPSPRKRISTHPRLANSENQNDASALSTSILILVLVIGGVILFSRGCTPEEPIGIQTPATMPMTSK